MNFRYILFDNKQIEINSINYKIVSIDEVNNTKINLDVIHNNKRYFKKIDFDDFKNKDKIIKNMIKFGKYKELKFYGNFPKYKFDDLKLVNELKNLNLNNLLKYVDELNKEIKTLNDLISFKVYLNKESMFTEYNSKDVEYNFEKSLVSIMCDCQFKDLENINICTYDIFSQKKGINIKNIIRDIKKKYNLKRNQVECNININNYNLMFDPEVFADLIEYYIINNSDLENYIKKDTFLQNSVFDFKLNILEKPFIKNSVFSLALDYDFVPTKEKYIIQDGKLVNYICDLNTAFKYNKEPSGNFLPNSITNIIVNKGDKSFNQLIKNSTILITDIIGLHTSNRKEGTLNVSCEGVLFVNGKKSKSFKDIKLNVNIVDLFKDIELSKETKQINNYNLPYVYCKRK